MAKKCVMMNRNKRTGKFQKKATSGSKRTKVCFSKGRSAKKRSGSRAKKKTGFTCISRKTGRFTRKVAGGGCRKGSKRSRSY